jgi:hypothetical protein
VGSMDFEPTRHATTLVDGRALCLSPRNAASRSYRAISARCGAIVARQATSNASNSSRLAQLTSLFGSISARVATVPSSIAPYSVASQQARTPTTNRFGSAHVRVRRPITLTIGCTWP